MGNNCLKSSETTETTPLVNDPRETTSSAELAFPHQDRPSALDAYSPSSYPTRTPLVTANPPILPKETSEFKYLESPRDFVLTRPEYPVPVLQNAFGNLFVRYDFALQVRVKVDEKLREFKSILNVHPDLKLQLCLEKWTKEMKNPVFNVSKTKTARKDVKSILVRADNIPRDLWPAQKFIREVLDACHLFIEQYEFLQQVINECLSDIVHQLERLEETLANSSSLSTPDSRYVQNLAPNMRNEYVQSLEWIQLFYTQILVLLDEIKSYTPLRD